MASTEIPYSRRALLPDSGRILAIDIIRGFAIMWVVLYHLWTDLHYPNVYAAHRATPSGPCRTASPKVTSPAA